MDEADANALTVGDFSGVGLLFRAEDGEKSGFAGAVRTDKAYAISVVDCAGNVVEERSDAEAFGDILRDQDRRHIFSLREEISGDLACVPWRRFVINNHQPLCHSWFRSFPSRAEGRTNSRYPESTMTSPKKSNRRVAVYCGSANGSNPAYLAEARALGALIASAGLGMVYGGASVGLMGAVADAALAGGAEVIGVLPEVLVGREIAHSSLTQFELAPTMHERNARMAELADAFLVLPGGYGTLEELLEAVTWAQLGLHSKPVILINTANYWDGLLSFLDSSVAAGFLKQKNRSLLRVAANAGEAVGMVVEDS